MIFPKSRELLGVNGFFTVKYKPDGTIERYKTRLVGQGLTQVFGIDYDLYGLPI